MTDYELGILANVRHAEALNSAANLARGRAATRYAPSDPYTFRWFMGSFRRWRENRLPGYVRHGGYGELYSGSFTAQGGHK